MQKKQKVKDPFALPWYFYVYVAVVVLWAVAVLLLAAGTCYAAQSAGTTVTVVITDEVSSSSTKAVGVFASVPCNEVNCSDTEPVETQSWWQSLWARVTSIF